MMPEMIKDWAWLQRSQWLKKEQIAEIQSRKLRAIVSHAFDKVPFYQRLYKTVGVDASSIRDTTTIGKLPIMTKQHARETPLAERTAVDTDVSSCILRTTSGSTGVPITILDDPYSAPYRLALHLRRLWAFGVRPLHKGCIVVPGNHRPSLLSNPKGLWGFFVTRKIRTLSLDADISDHVRLISRWKPDFLMGTPSYFRMLVRFCEETEQSLAIRMSVITGEMMDNSTRSLIADRLHTDIRRGYGAAEVGPIAWECPSGSGYHINGDAIIAEFLRDGEHVANGEAGELCITNLYRTATPMIRYLVGDVATFLGDDCSCGRGLPLLKDIQGRTLDFVLTRDGRYLSPLRIMFMLEDVPGVAQYKVIQKQNRSIELLVRTLKVENEPVLQALEQRCRQLFGDLPLDIRTVDRIDDPKAHKSRIVESLLTRGMVS